MINIKNLSFSYGEKKLFKNFSLVINKGERICLFGQSGCGKTTLLRLIMGLEKVTTGEIKAKKNLKFSCVFQDDLLLPFKTVLENVMLVGCSEKTARENLKELGLLGCENLLPKKLSGGMQRRVAIARALSAEFDILLLDEPFSGLDIENIKIAAQQILTVSKEHPIILVSHSMDEAKLLDAKIVNI